MTEDAEAMQKGVNAHRPMTGNLNVHAILICLVLMLPSGVRGCDRYDEVVKYDKYFSKYTRRYFGPDFDRRYFKAQAIAESRLKPEARSGEGALGPMQILPRTFREITEKNPGIKSRIGHPRWNIAAGIYYNRIMWNA